MNMGELCQCEVLSDDDGAEYCRGGVQLLASLQVPQQGSLVSTARQGERLADTDGPDTVTVSL